MKGRALRAALYHRVSTLDQDPTLARGQLRAAAKALGARIVMDVEETGSGAANDRAGLLRVMSAVVHGELDLVVVWKLDRWGRSLIDIVENVKVLQERGVRFLCTSQGLDFGPSAGGAAKFYLAILGAAAELERDHIRERTMLGIERARKRGAAIGRPKVARPDAERVRELLNVNRWQRPNMERVAKELGCTMHALRAVVLELRCQHTYKSWRGNERSCTDVSKARCTKCTALLCMHHLEAGDHSCAELASRLLRKGDHSPRAAPAPRSPRRRRRPGKGPLSRAAELGRRPGKKGVPKRASRAVDAAARSRR